jgi:hypothetical protein
MKKTAIALLVTAVVLGSSLTALANLPLNGLYNSTDLGGLTLLGHGSNSRPVPDTGLNNVFNSQSWNGTALGTQWKFTCGISYAQQRLDNRNASGTGTVIFTTLYTGGTFWLSGNGPWGTGANDFAGSIDGTTRITTLQYVNWVPVQARENINSSGVFDSGCLLTFAIANGTGVGDTDLMPFDPNFPALIDTDCSSPRASGSWGTLSQISFLIDCVVPNQASSWGSLKTQYR